MNGRSAKKMRRFAQFITMNVVGPALGAGAIKKRYGRNHQGTVIKLGCAAMYRRLKKGMTLRAAIQRGFNLTPKDMLKVQDEMLGKLGG